MLIWRICPESYGSKAFTGSGGLQYGARWHQKARIVYASENLSLAALEFFVNLNPDQCSVALVAVSAAIPKSVRIITVRPLDLPSDLRKYPAPAALQRIGTEWIRSGNSAVLAVPSALVPTERNFLLNPGHPHFAAIIINQPEPFYFDGRMWKAKRR